MSYTIWLLDPNTLGKSILLMVRPQYVSMPELAYQYASMHIWPCCCHKSIIVEATGSSWQNI